MDGWMDGRSEGFGWMCVYRGHGDGWERKALVGVREGEGSECWVGI